MPTRITKDKVDLIQKHLPTTYFAHLNSEQRLKLFVKHWKRLVLINQQLEKTVFNAFDHY